MKLQSIEFKLAAVISAAGVLLSSGCSIKRMAVNKVGDALAGGGTTFSAENDPELVRDAAPFSLKLMETLLAESPKHKGLLHATASGFTQYAYAFLQQEADELQDTDLAASQALRERARKMYLRARDYGLRGLEARHKGFSALLRAAPKVAVTTARKADVPAMYWTAASWAAAISLSKDDASLIADLPIVEALMDRALELDESWGDGALHSFFISYEMARQGVPGDAAARSRKHFDRAMELTGGKSLGPLVSLAESVALDKQDRKEFEALLQRALAVDIDARPEWRLANSVTRRRAKWLLGRMDKLFLD